MNYTDYWRQWSSWVWAEYKKPMTEAEKDEIRRRNKFKRLLKGNATMKLNDEIDKMYMLKQQKKGLEDQVKEVAAKISECEQNLLTRLNEVGTNTARGELASATITESLVPRIEDWGEVSEWIMANDAIYLCHRRISSGPWKELLDSGETVPGIVPFTKTAISLRKRGD